MGVSENPPWIVRQGDEAAEVEAALIGSIARRFGAHDGWQWGGLQEHFETISAENVEQAVDRVERLIRLAYLSDRHIFVEAESLTRRTGGA